MWMCFHNRTKCYDEFTSLNNETEKEIIKYYKIINVDYFNSILVKSKITNDYNILNVEIINSMLYYYLNHKDKHIYTKTDYLCNEKERICICNTNADLLRKIYDGINYKNNNKYISWFHDKDKDYYD
jgi:hypothetical protein